MYRVFSLNGMVGAGFGNAAAFENALHNFTFDLVANDAGSMDMGPAYLGSGTQFFDDADVLVDLRYLVRLARANTCPLVIGTCGTSGDTPHLRQTQALLAQVLTEQGLSDLTVAVIDSHIDGEALAERAGMLTPLGRPQPPTPELVRRSRCVGQMGSGPIITALDAGADIVLAGRACDVSVVAAGMIRDGIDPGIAHHVGHVMECGGIALDPSSALDCIIAEVEDGNATFISPATERRATIKSVAAHSLYEEDHVALQFYPEGALTLEPTIYHQRSAETAGFRGSTFVRQPLSLKIEGSADMGERVCSFIPCDAVIPLADDFFVYGRNGVAPWPVGPGEREVGVLLRVAGPDEAQVETILTIIKLGMLHYGYPNRITTSGNVAFPFSPTSFIRATEAGTFESVSVMGTREPLFISQFDDIAAALRERARSLHPHAYAACRIDISLFDNDRPLAVIASVGDDTDTANRAHQAVLDRLRDQLHVDDPAAIVGIKAGPTYQWSVFHVLADEEFIKNQLFKIEMNHWDGTGWQVTRHIEPAHPEFGVVDDGTYDLNPRTLMAIEPVHHHRPPEVHKPLLGMCEVIRSKDAGAGILTYDVFFDSQEDYERALVSGLFDIAKMAELFDNDEQDWIACSRADNCRAMKLARFRVLFSGSKGSRDTYGSQQHMPIEQLQVPVY